MAKAKTIYSCTECGASEPKWQGQCPSCMSCRRADEVGHEHARRTLVDLARRAELLDHALVHDRDRVGHRHRLDLVVRDVHRRRAQPLVQEIGRASCRERVWR